MLLPPDDLQPTPIAARSYLQYLGKNNISATGCASLAMERLSSNIIVLMLSMSSLTKTKTLFLIKAANIYLKVIGHDLNNCIWVCSLVVREMHDRRSRMHLFRKNKIIEYQEIISYEK